MVPGFMALAVIAVLLVGVAPQWTTSARAAMKANTAAPSQQAVDWLSGHVSKHAYLLVDDSVWTDLVDRGFQRSHTIWYSKLDLDPTLGGVRWNRFKYVVWSNLVPLRDWGPNARSVYYHSRPVVSFRSGSEVVQIRRVTGVTPTGG